MSDMKPDRSMPTKVMKVLQFVDQNIPVQTIGALGGTPAVNAAGQTGNSLVTNGWSNNISNLLNVGDVISIANVFAVNPQSRLYRCLPEIFVHEDRGEQMTDTPTSQPDVSDERLTEIAKTLALERPLTQWEAEDALRSVRDQARAAERKRTLEEAIKLCHRVDGAYEQWVQTVAAKLRRAAEEGGSDAA
jgi:hypothetical protein